MCGLAGWIGIGASAKAVAAMVDSLRARGPDGFGVQRVSSHCVLGHSRLAIIDLSAAGAQPISDPTETAWAVVNGEIYNYKELRCELEASGAQFRSDCDSEVVIHGYLAWGEAVVARLQGIFAFAVYDTRANSLLLARDRVGVKPLYYALYEGCLLFASELKALNIPQLPGLRFNPLSMHVFLAHRYLPAPLTPYQDIFKLEPGQMLHYANGRVCRERYWFPVDRESPCSAHKAANLLTDALHESIEAQLMSDVPIGLLLSGGIDSSSVAVMAASRCPSLEAFCCGFDQLSHDERGYARHAAQCAGIRLHEMVMDWPLLQSRIPQFLDWFDEPYFNYSAVAVHELCLMARNLGIKVLLAGEGADELFAGYIWYDDFAARDMGGGDQALDLFFSYKGFFTGQMQDELAGRSLGYDHLEVLRRFDRPDLPAVSRAQWLDFHTFLPDDVLFRDDRASMAVGIELRVPYLDERLLDQWFLLPQSIVYQAGERKHLLKKALAGILPSSILTNRKKGFGFPLHVWEGPIRAMTTRLLREGLLMTHGYVMREALQSIVPGLRIDFVWQLLMAELWMRRFIAREDIEALLGIDQE